MPSTTGIDNKELREKVPAKHDQGLLGHTTGWSLNDNISGGSFLYQLANSQVMISLIVDRSCAPLPVIAH